MIRATHTSTREREERRPYAGEGGTEEDESGIDETEAGPNEGA